LKTILRAYAYFDNSVNTISVRYAEFTPRPVNQAGAEGEEAGRRLANGSEEGGAKCICDVHTELLDHDGIMRL